MRNFIAENLCVCYPADRILCMKGVEKCDAKVFCGDKS